MCEFVRCQQDPLLKSCSNLCLHMLIFPGFYQKYVCSYFFKKTCLRTILISLWLSIFSHGFMVLRSFIFLKFLINQVTHPLSAWNVENIFPRKPVAFWLCNCSFKIEFFPFKKKNFGSQIYHYFLKLHRNFQSWLENPFPMAKEKFTRTSSSIWIFFFTFNNVCILSLSLFMAWNILWVSFTSWLIGCDSIIYEKFCVPGTGYLLLSNTKFPCSIGLFAELLF